MLSGVPWRRGGSFTTSDVEKEQEEQRGSVLSVRTGADFSRLFLALCACIYVCEFVQKWLYRSYIGEDA